VYAPTETRRPKLSRSIGVAQSARVRAGVYAFTAGFPKQETYGLALQTRRAAVSIPANIAEGFRRRGKAEKARYRNIAEGSVEESRYYLILAQDLATATLPSWPDLSKRSADCSALTPPRFGLLAPEF
jgi:four helix bundle protein